jgi:hypothetical protein
VKGKEDRNEEEEIILEFFERLENELPNVNLLQKKVT